MTADTAICFMPYEIFIGLGVLFNFYIEDSYSEIGGGVRIFSPLPTLFSIVYQKPTQTQLLKFRKNRHIFYFFALPLINRASLLIVGHANLEHIFLGKIDFFALVGK
jgi:hypothetical protein